MKAGRTKGKIMEHQTKMTVNGTPFIQVLFVLEEGETITAPIWLSEKAAPIAVQHLRSVGFDVEKQSLAELDDNPTLLAGRLIHLEIEEVVYNGQVTYRANFPLAERLSGDQIKRYDAVLRAALKVDRKIQKEDSAAAGPEDDNIPF